MVLLPFRSVQFLGSITGNTIWVTFTEEGAQKLQAYSKSNIGHYLVIVKDGVVISSPAVNSEIVQGSAIITGDFTMEKATELASIIGGHRLPYSFKILSQVRKQLIHW